MIHALLKLQKFCFLKVYTENCVQMVSNFLLLFSSPADSSKGHFFFFFALFFYLFGFFFFFSLYDFVDFILFIVLPISLTFVLYGI